MNYEKDQNTTPSPNFPKITADLPATEKQRALLRLAIRKDYLQPNTFAGNYESWEKLTAAEAEDMLAALPPEKLDELEKELKEKPKKYQDRGLVRSIGRSIEDGIKQIGHAIDGGIS